MNKKTIIISSILVSLAIIASVVFININNNDEEVKRPEVENSNTADGETIDFLKAVSGIKASNIELIDDPVGIKGEFIAPKDSILRGVDYFLTNTENDKMEDVKIDIGNEYISVKVNYKITTGITTPIEVRVNPFINSEKDLVLDIVEVKFLDLKIANWIVDLALKNFIKDWFPTDGDFVVKFNEGEVVVYKENFDELILNKLEVSEDGLNLDMIVNLEKTL